VRKDTRGELLMILETVFLETPDSRAMSLIVAALPFDAGNAASLIIRTDMYRTR
jgi:hypothetical protein